MNFLQKEKTVLDTKLKEQKEHDEDILEMSEVIQVNCAAESIKSLS